MSIFKDISLIGKASSTIEGLEKERAGLQAQLDSLRDEKNQADSELARLRAEHKDTQEENDQILSQLHGVQEELVDALSKGSDAQKRVAFLQSLWDRYFQSHPEYLSYESVECFNVNHENRSISWAIRELHAPGKCQSLFEFETFIEAGVTGFRFRRNRDGGSPLIRWPISGAKENLLECIPVEIKANDFLRAKIFKELSTSDWSLLQRLPAILKDAVDFCEPLIEDPIPLLKGLGKFEQVISKVPNMPRFDKATLTNECVHPEYEHLELRVSNLSIEGRLYPSLKFRIACSNVKPDRFGTDPKLEFPKPEGGSLLDAWYEESMDSFGPKLELRFAIPNAIDLDILSKLSGQDKALVGTLLDLAPIFLEEVYKQYSTNTRPMHHWVKACQDMLLIMRKHYP